MKGLAIIAVIFILGVIFSAWVRQYLTFIPSV